MKAVFLEEEREGRATFTTLFPKCKIIMWEPRWKAGKESFGEQNSNYTVDSLVSLLPTLIPSISFFLIVITSVSRTILDNRGDNGIS